MTQNFVKKIDIRVLTRGVGTLDPHQVSSQDTHIRLVAKGGFPCVLVVRKCVPFCHLPLLGDTEVSPIDCHETVVEDIPLFLTVKVDLRGGGGGDGGGGDVRRQWQTTTVDGGWQQCQVDGDDISWRWWPSDAVAIGNKINEQMQKNKEDSNQLGYGLNEGPYPFAVGLRVDGIRQTRRQPSNPSPAWGILS
jgi:hypothetical protein